MSFPNKGPGCGNKRRYASKEEALTVTRTKPKQLRPYECKICGGWHLTGMSMAYWIVVKHKPGAGQSGEASKP